METSGNTVVRRIPKKENQGLTMEEAVVIADKILLGFSSDDSASSLKVSILPLHNKKNKRYKKYYVLEETTYEQGGQNQ